MILQLYPQDFVVDGCRGHHDPHKMLASCLVINVHLATVSVQEHNALVGAVNLASVLVEESVFEPQAACYAAVRPEDRREGIALLDIGAESTGMVVYYGDSCSAPAPSSAPTALRSAAIPPRATWRTPCASASRTPKW